MSNSKLHREQQNSPDDAWLLCYGRLHDYDHPWWCGLYVQSPNPEGLWSPLHGEGGVGAPAAVAEAVRISETVGVTVRIKSQVCGCICHSDSFTKVGLSPGIRYQVSGH